MPTIPNYNIGNDDLNAMDDLLLIKRKMLNKMKIEETEVKFDSLKNVDSKLIISNYNEAEKLLRATIELFKTIDTRIDIPKLNVKGNPISSIVKETDITIIDINDTIDKIVTNFKVLYETIKELLPFSKFLSQKKFDIFYTLVGDFHNNINLFIETKLMDNAGNVLLRIMGNTRFTVPDLIANFNFLNYNFDKFYNLWKQFISNYKSEEKVEIK